MKTPRYEVISMYPKSPFMVGEVLMLEKFFESFVYFLYTDEGKDWLYQSELDEYPNIFKKLND